MYEKLLCVCVCLFGVVPLNRLLAREKRPNHTDLQLLPLENALGLCPAFRWGAAVETHECRGLSLSWPGPFFSGSGATCGFNLGRL